MIRTRFGNASVLSHLIPDNNPPPPWGRGWAAAGVFSSRGGPGEGVRPNAPVGNNNVGQDTSGHPKRLPKARQREQKPANWLAVQRTESLSIEGKGKKNSSELNERPVNVLGNKGPLWKTRGLSRYVFENKGC